MIQKEKSFYATLVIICIDIVMIMGTDSWETLEQVAMGLHAESDRLCDIEKYRMIYVRWISSLTNLQTVSYDYNDQKSQNQARFFSTLLILPLHMIHIMTGCHWQY